MPCCLFAEISCPKLNAPANGNLFPPECETTGNVYQEKCHYSCSNGYDLNGVSVKTCGSNGQWDDQSDPTCSLCKSCLVLSYLVVLGLSYFALSRFAVFSVFCSLILCPVLACLGFPCVVWSCPVLSYLISLF